MAVVGFAGGTVLVNRLTEISRILLDDMVRACYLYDKIVHFQSTYEQLQTFTQKSLNSLNNKCLSFGHFVGTRRLLKSQFCRVVEINSRTHVQCDLAYDRNMDAICCTIGVFK
jgi:hypothetical protein